MELSNNLTMHERMQMYKERANKYKEEFETENEYTEKIVPLDVCKKCWMATYTGSVWYCPLPYCER